jgi:hypothetical protein
MGTIRLRVPNAVTPGDFVRSKRRFPVGPGEVYKTPPQRGLFHLGRDRVSAHELAVASGVLGFENRLH